MCRCGQVEYAKENELDQKRSEQYYTLLGLIVLVGNIDNLDARLSNGIIFSPRTLFSLIVLFIFFFLIYRYV